jgi:hypothetical protein
MCVCFSLVIYDDGCVIFSVNCVSRLGNSPVKVSRFLEWVVMSTFTTIENFLVNSADICHYKIRLNKT